MEDSVATIVPSEDGTPSNRYSYSPSYNEIDKGDGIRNFGTNVVNPVDVNTDLSRPEDDPDKDRRDKYLEDRVTSIRKETQGLGDVAHPEVSDDLIKSAESRTLDEAKKFDPDFYESLLYESEARAQMQIEEAMSQHEADQLYDRIRMKTGEVLHTNSDMSQKEAAAYAIASLTENDPSFKQINPIVYGAFQSWALANIEMNRLADENMKRKKAEALEKALARKNNQKESSGSKDTQEEQ